MWAALRQTCLHSTNAMPDRSTSAAVAAVFGAKDFKRIALCIFYEPVYPPASLRATSLRFSQAQILWLRLAESFLSQLRLSTHYVLIQQKGMRMHLLTDIH